MSSPRLDWPATMSPAKDPEYLTIGPAAKRAGVSVGWLRKLADDEDKAPGTGIACVRFGTTRFFRPAVLDAYRRERERAKRPNR